MYCTGLNVFEILKKIYNVDASSRFLATNVNVGGAWFWYMPTSHLFLVQFTLRRELNTLLKISNFAPPLEGQTLDTASLWLAFNFLRLWHGRIDRKFVVHFRTILFFFMSKNRTKNHSSILMMKKKTDWSFFKWVFDRFYRQLRKKIIITFNRKEVWWRTGFDINPWKEFR